MNKIKPVHGIRCVNIYLQSFTFCNQFRLVVVVASHRCPAAALERYFYIEHVKSRSTDSNVIHGVLQVPSIRVNRMLHPVSNRLSVLLT